MLVERLFGLSSWKERAHLFRTMPRRSLVTFLAAVWCLFAAIGGVNDSLRIENSQPSSFLWLVLMTGTTAVLWALFGTMRMIKSLIAMAVFQLTIFLFAMPLWLSEAQALTPDQLKQKLALHDAAVLVFVLSGYVLFVAFFRMEGKRFFAAHTEIALASSIQRDLVPTISMKAGAFEFYGLSVPSGTVGGDLLDVVTAGGSFCAYVADVAGHGVPAGVLMSMVKSAVRMRVASIGPRDDELLPILNSTLQPLTAPNAYVTFAYVSGEGGPLLSFSLAGHLPLFHFQHGTQQVERCSVENLPLGIFAGVEYGTGTLECKPGDLVAIVTDGLTEIFNSDDRELGSDYIERLLAQSAAEPLPKIAMQITRSSEAFGKVTDDRTMLLMRCIS